MEAGSRANLTVYLDLTPVPGDNGTGTRFHVTFPIFDTEVDDA